MPRRTSRRSTRIPTRVARFLRKSRSGHLATVDAEGRPVAVPFAYVFDGKRLYSSIDEKPKRVPPARLARARNIERNPEVAVIVDHYEEDWSKLCFVLIRGRATLLKSGKEHARAIRLLRRKYPQYRAMRIEKRPIVRIIPWRVRDWAADESTR